MEESPKREINEIMLHCGMPVWGAVPFNKIECSLIQCSGLKRLPKATRTVIVSLFPYYCVKGGGQISRYAAAKDYHIVAKNMLNRAVDLFKERFKEHEFVSFCDASPIPEVKAASIAGLGVVGRNGMLITKEYGSYIFIGEIVTDVLIESITAEQGKCISCGLCEKKCPAGAISNCGIDKERCVSHLTQKKGELAPEEKLLLRKASTIWGCDICQNVCPMNNNAKETYIDDFKNDIINSLSIDEIERRDFKKTYETRAFLWRGKNVLRRNISILLETSENNNQENCSKE